MFNSYSRGKRVENVSKLQLHISGHKLGFEVVWLRRPGCRMCRTSQGFLAMSMGKQAIRGDHLRIAKISPKLVKNPT